MKVTPRAGWADVGIFGGVVPEPDTLEPTADRSTGGAFWSLSRSFGGRLGVHQDGRIAVVSSPELGTRYEATVGGGAWWKAAHVSAEAQVGTGGKAEAASGHLDAARVDVSAHLARRVSLGGGFRHTGLEWPAPSAALEPALFPGRSNAADGWASVDLWILRLGGSGGFSRDLGSGLDRSWLGPELGLTRLWGGRIAVAAGYLEERGWLAGRSAWLQASLRAGAPPAHDPGDLDPRPARGGGRRRARPRGRRVGGPRPGLRRPGLRARAHRHEPRRGGRGRVLAARAERRGVGVRRLVRPRTGAARRR